MVRKGQEWTGGTRWPDTEQVRTNHEKPLLLWVADDTARTNPDQIQGIAGMIEKYFLREQVP